jgi:hypothetical protein
MARSKTTSQQRDGIEKKKPTSAVAVNFGFDFQSNAAIMLMLKNIKIATKVKVEGEKEDIEITLNNGNIIMAQAKAVEKMDDYRNVISNLTKGLNTLNEAQAPNVEQLIFITNSPNPFNDKTTMYAFSSPLNEKPYSELPNKCRSKIDKLCKENDYSFDKRLLKIYVMQFHGEDLSERYKVLTEKINIFLNDLEIGYMGLGEQILHLWQSSFRDNASQRTTSITKKTMVWPVIAILCNIDTQELEDHDENDIAEISRRYKDIISNNVERFDFFSKVISDYSDYQKINFSVVSRKLTSDFIENKWIDYKADFDMKMTDHNIMKTVIKITISNILRNRSIINTIKGKLNL